jgi:hypothetical protein
MDSWIDGQIDRWIDGQLNSWTVGQMDSWTDGQINKRFYGKVRNIINALPFLFSGWKSPDGCRCHERPRPQLRGRDVYRYGNPIRLSVFY